MHTPIKQPAGNQVPDAEKNKPAGESGFEVARSAGFESATF
ncbi:hypothetical protein [Saccharothrix sp. ALI-22-I]|nr:hypothetical protein [Saccharothrix sp. ALI-22-I]